MSLRTALVVTLALGLLTGPHPAKAQALAKVYRIGALIPVAAPTAPDPYSRAFLHGLRERGYVEGQNLIVEVRYAEGRLDRLHDLATELVGLGLDLIVAVGPQAMLAAKQATTRIPIVTVSVLDPVEAGVVDSLARPGGNITGLTSAGAQLSGKWLELLKQAVSGARRIAVLANPTNAAHATYWRESQTAAQTLGVTLHRWDVRKPSEFEAAFAAMVVERAGAVVVLPDPLTTLNRQRVVDLAARRRLPAMYAWREFVEAGGLMSYSPSGVEMFRRAATYVDRVLKGAKPADLPVEQPTKFELVINLNTAKALGLTIPPSVLARADEVIE